LHHSSANCAPLKKIFALAALKSIITREATLWNFCKGCKIGCPYEVSALANSPRLALESGLNFLRVFPGKKAGGSPAAAKSPGVGVDSA